MGSAAYEERFSIPAEEQNAGRVVDYIFFRVEFHSTPGFFSDSNYLFFLLKQLVVNSKKDWRQRCRAKQNGLKKDRSSLVFF